MAGRFAPRRGPPRAPTAANAPTFTRTPFASRLRIASGQRQLAAEPSEAQLVQPAANASAYFFHISAVSGARCSSGVIVFDSIWKGRTRTPAPPDRRAPRRARSARTGSARLVDLEAGGLLLDRRVLRLRESGLQLTGHLLEHGGLVGLDLHEQHAGRRLERHLRRRRAGAAALPPRGAGWPAGGCPVVRGLSEVAAGASTTARAKALITQERIPISSLGERPNGHSITASGATRPRQTARISDENRHHFVGHQHPARVSRRRRPSRTSQSLLHERRERFAVPRPDVHAVARRPRRPDRARRVSRSPVNSASSRRSVATRRAVPSPDHRRSSPARCSPRCPIRSSSGRRVGSSARRSRKRATRRRSST